MSTENTDVSEPQAFAGESFLPHDDDALDGDDLPDDGEVTFRALSEPGFAYIGRGMTLDEFAEYLAGVDPGPIPPGWVVLHHTAIPSASWAPHGRGMVWDANEDGLTESALRNKRTRQLDGIQRFYQNSKGWNAGPHLFIDERYIWLFTPMTVPGIHAASGNWVMHNGRRVHSIGIEVVGDFTRRKWRADLAAMVGKTVAMLAEKFGTFTPDSHQAGPGGLSSHRDYNKPSCPGNAITDAYYRNICAMAWHARSKPAISGEITRPDPAPALGNETLSSDSMILHAPRESLDQMRVIWQRRAEYQDNGYTVYDVCEVILPEYWNLACAVGIDPVGAIAQMAHETGWLTSFWSRRPQRNPAGLGVNGVSSLSRPRVTTGWAWNDQRNRWEVGLSFPTWQHSIRAHLGRLLAYALPAGTENAIQGALIHQALRYRPLPLRYRGSAAVYKNLGAKHNRNESGWAFPGDDYGDRIVQIMREICGV